MVAVGLKNENIARGLRRTIGVAATHILQAFSGTQGNDTIPHRVGPVDEKAHSSLGAHQTPTLDGVPAPTIPPRQPPVATSTDDPDDVHRIVALLDAAIALPRGACTPCVWAAHAGPNALMAFQIWATLHRFELDDNTLNTGAFTLRRIDVYDGDRMVAGLQWPLEPKAVH